MESLRNFVDNYEEQLFREEIDNWKNIPNKFRQSLKYHLIEFVSIKENNYDEILENQLNDRILFFDDWNKLTKLDRTNKFIELINETLRSKSINDFTKAIINKFKDLDNEYVKIEKIDSSISNNKSGAFKITLNWYEAKNNKLKRFIYDNLTELLKLCKFYRYYISQYFLDYKGLGFGYIIFEPLDTEEVTKEIKTKFNNKVYHVTSKEFINSIKENGLLISSPSTHSDYNNPQYFISIKDLYKPNKEEIDELSKTTRGRIRANNRYRNFTDRIFVFYSDKNIKDNAKYICQLLHKDPKNSIIIEIDLTGHKNPFFRDTIMINNDKIHSAYSNIDIPAKLISRIIEL